MTTRTLGTIAKTGHFSNAWVRNELQVNGSGRRNSTFVDIITNPAEPAVTGTQSLLFYYPATDQAPTLYNTGNAADQMAFADETGDEAVTFKSLMDNTLGDVTLRLPDGSVDGDPLHMIDGQLKFIVRAAASVNDSFITYLDFVTQAVVIDTLDTPIHTGRLYVFRSDYNIRGWTFVEHRRSS